jgi:hypothetical protein
MIRYSCVFFSLAFVLTAIPLRAANRPHAGTDGQTVKVWTNDDLERLHDLGLICIVAQINEETPKQASLPELDMKTPDPEWYPEQGARLRDEREHKKARIPSSYRRCTEP